MKKTLIAGVASIALTAMPMVGVFATDPTITDSLTLTLSSSCTFNASTHTYNATMSVNQLNSSVGTTTVNVKCNKYNGYYVTVAMTDLTNSSSTSNKIPYSGSSDPVAGTARWTAYKVVNTTYTKITSGGRIMENSASTSASGDSQTVAYKVSTGSWQPTGTYSGTATYTLTSPYVAAS